jgi:cytoskeleton protein RodZ
LFQRLKTPFARDPREAEATPASGPLSVADALRRQREALHLELGEVAAALRIKPAYLSALEAGRPDQLPGPTYAIGFVRAYADHLGLDGREVVRRFKQDSTALATKPDLAFPMPLSERSIPGAGMLLVALILAICGYGTWYYLSTGEGSRPERVARVPADLLPSKPEERRTEPAAPRSAEALAAPPLAVAAADAPLASDLAGVGSDSPRLPSADPFAPPQDVGQIAAATPSQGVAGGARIFLRATADSWVQIRDASQSVLLTRLLKAGQSYPVPDQPGLSMRTGNAGGLDITVDGNPAPSIGRMGMVRRKVALDPEALTAGAAVRQ